MKRAIVLGFAVLLSACGSQQPSGSGGEEVITQAQYQQLCRDSPKGSGKTTYDASGKPTCFNGVLISPGGGVVRIVP
jgi:hypothetical protein